MRQILAIQKHGGFVRAAEELGISQPALSRSVLRLEDELGAKLFDRSRSGAVATPLGLALIERAEHLVMESGRLIRDMELISLGRSGEIRIGIGLSAITAMPRIAVDLAERFPGLVISLITGSDRLLAADLALKKLDLVVITEAEKFNDQKGAYLPILNYRMLAIARPDHPLVKCETVSLDEFVAYPTVGPFNTQVFTALDPIHASRRHNEPAPAIITTNLETVKALILDHGMTHIGIEYQFRPHLRAGLIKTIELAWTMEFTLGIAMTRAASHSPVVMQCASTIRDAIRDISA